MKIFQNLLLFLFFCPAAYSQLSIGDSYKKQLMETVKPNSTFGLQKPKIAETSVTANPILQAYGKYKSTDRLLEMFKDEYKISPNAITYNGTVPLNKLPAGSMQTEYMGGHFVNFSNAGKLVVPTGINLSGGVRKKLSPKTKSILINVFGMEIEE